MKHITLEILKERKQLIRKILGGNVEGVKERQLTEQQQEFKETMDKVLKRLANMLLEKNISYGNSALEPINIFSKLNAQEQLNVRMDDKISRLARGQEFGTEDTKLDLLGYLVLDQMLKIKGDPITESNFTQLLLDKAESILQKEEEESPTEEYFLAKDPTGQVFAHSEMPKRDKVENWQSYKEKYLIKDEYPYNTVPSNAVEIVEWTDLELEEAREF